MMESVDLWQVASKSRFNWEYTVYSTHFACKSVTVQRKIPSESLMLQSLCRITLSFSESEYIWTSISVVDVC
jgi:hypothetical protein